MTILDATHKLFDYFSNKHTYSTSKNFKDIVPITEDEELDVATINLALEDMEKNEILKSTDLNGEKCYILNRQLESFEQSVSISYPTAMMLAQALNEFCETIEDYTDVADVGNITEKDVRNLVILNQHHKMEMTKLLGENSQSEFGGESINFDNI
tara:strand:- start:291 stop:755 length:465 start_codon:yes stop_codon:yes gene_type:complete